MKKLKILLVTEYFPPKMYGGGEISAQNLARKLAEAKQEVTVLTSWFDGLSREEKKDGYKIIRKLNSGEPNSLYGNIKRKVCFQKNLLKELKKFDEKFDVVHFLNTTSIPKIKLKTKTVATINGYTHFCPKRNLFYKEKNVCEGCKPWKFISCIVKSNYIGKQKNERWMRYNPFFWMLLYRNYIGNKRKLQTIDTFISISKFIDKQLLKNGVHKNQIQRNYNILDLKTTGPKFEIKEKGVNFVYIGYLEKIKGVEMLVKAFKNVKDANLLIFGSGSEKEKLKKLAGRNVKFYGDVNYNFMPSIYKQADVIVQPALWPEPMSRVILEATYFGKPIIATANGGNSDGVIEGKNGFLVKNEKEVIKRINYFCKNKNQRKKMGFESKKIFNERFLTKKVLEKTLVIYSK